MIRTGQKAPDFALPGVERGQPDIYELFRAIGDGDAVLLWFFPATFLPTATAELSAMADAGWGDVDGLKVWGISMDSIYASAAYADQYDLPFALLGDGASAADYYGVRDDEWEGHYDVPRRAAFLVGDDWEIRVAWSTEDAFEASSPSPVAVVGDALEASFGVAVPDVEYDAFFG